MTAQHAGVDGLVLARLEILLAFFYSKNLKAKKNVTFILEMDKRDIFILAMD